MKGVGHYTSHHEKVRGPIYLQQSHDYLTIMPKLQSTYGRHLSYKTSYDYCKKNLQKTRENLTINN